MKEFDSFIVSRWFWKYVEYGRLGEFKDDVFKGWLEENEVDVEFDEDDERSEIVELLILGELSEAVEEVEDWEANEYVIKLLELERVYYSSKTHKMVDSLMTQLSNINIPEELEC